MIVQEFAKDSHDLNEKVKEFKLYVKNKKISKKNQMKMLAEAYSTKMKQDEE
jgi:hypothetical protein